MANTNNIAQKKTILVNLLIFYYLKYKLTFGVKCKEWSEKEALIWQIIF